MGDYTTAGQFQVVDGQLVQLISTPSATAQFLYGVASTETYNNNRTFTSFNPLISECKKKVVPVIHTLNLKICLILKFLITSPLESLWLSLSASKNIYGALG